MRGPFQPLVVQNWKTDIPPLMKPLTVHVAQPAGLAAEEYGRNTWPVGLTATECALFPISRVAVSARLVASFTPSVGVHRLFAAQPPPSSLSPRRASGFPRRSRRWCARHRP